MADRMLFIGWSTPVRGREERALEVFDETVGLYGRLQQQGRIESFDVVLLSPSGGQLNGYFQVHGSAQQLAALREDQEFKRSLVDASLIIDALRVIDGFANNGVAEQMALFREAVGRVPQHV